MASDFTSTFTIWQWIWRSSRYINNVLAVYCILANNWLTCCMMFKLVQVVILIITFIHLSPCMISFPGMHQGMLSPGLVPQPGPSPLPHFGTAFGSWESPPYSPTSYRQFPTPGTPTIFVQFCVEQNGKCSQPHNYGGCTYPTQLNLTLILYAKHVTPPPFP